MTSLLGSLVDLVRGVLHPLSNGVIILRTSPLDNLGVAEVHFGRVQAQGVTTALGGGLHPEVTDGLPVELDGGEVGGGDLGVELGEFFEEGVVDDADAVEEFVVVGSGYGAGDEDITEFISREQCYSRGGWKGGVLDVRNDHGSSLGGKLAQALEAESAADRGDIGERLEDVGVADRVTVVEQNHRCRDGFTRHDSRDDVSLGVRDVGSKRSSSLSQSASLFQTRYISRADKHTSKN